MTNDQTKLSYDEEQTQMKEEKSKNYEETFPPSWKAPEGTTIIKFLTDERKTQQTEEGPRKILNIEVNGQSVSFWINPKNPIYSKIVAEGVKRKTLIGVKASLTRIGEQKATRYGIKFE